MIETSRSGLVGQYIGQSEKIASEKIQAARGGVLFIDEIYALSETGGANYDNRDFGVKVIDTLMPVLADESSNIMVIGAGYTPEMKRFLKANSGIASRFPIVLEFKDFTLEELMTIANDYLTRYDFRMTPTAEEKLKQLLSETSSIEDSGNARLVKTLINNYIIPNLCMRLDRNGCNCNDHERLSLIIPADIPELSEVVPLHAQEQTRIGFQTRSPLKHT